MKANEVKNTVNWDFMKPEAISIAPNATVREALVLMQKFQIHHLLVMDGDNFKGLIEARDILFSMASTPGLLNVQKASDVMRQVPMIYDSTDVGGALEMMLSNRVTALPITEKGRIVGILTETDLLKLLSVMLGKNTGLPILVDEGMAVLANPLVQNVLQLLSNMGL